MNKNKKILIFAVIIFLFMVTPLFIIIRNNQKPSFPGTNVTPTPVTAATATPAVTGPPQNSPAPADGCIISGCSSEICSDREMFSTCILKPENECYKNAACQRQNNGKCGWTESAELKSCLEKFK